MVKQASGKKYRAEDMDSLYQQYAAEFGPVVAERAIAILCGTLGGSECYVPRLSTLERMNRDRAICELADTSGYSPTQIAASNNISERSVRRILRKNN